VATASGPQLYVRSLQATLWAAPSFQADRMTLLSRGDAVEALEEKEGWVSVRYAQQQGWMLKLMLAPTPPGDSKASDQEAQELLKQRARRRPSAFSSTAAARGLMDKEETFGTELKLDYQAVEKMESWRVDEMQAMQFLIKGKNDEEKP